MTARDFALALLESTTLEGKLAAPPQALRLDPAGPPLRVHRPARPPNLAIVAKQRVRVPHLAGMPDPAQRRRIVHALANHELQAAELFAWALLAFPDTPAAFRRGCLAILVEEQRHLRLYLDRLEHMGGTFGEEPVSAHFWHKSDVIHTAMDFICTMGLTFENANLDFSLEHAEAAEQAGDRATAEVLRVIHRDEIRHVRFAWRWLMRWKPADEDPWITYCNHVAQPLGPARARGTTFDPASRQAAGLHQKFIESLAAIAPTAPGGAKRR